MDLCQLNQSDLPGIYLASAGIPCPPAAREWRESPPLPEETVGFSLLTSYGGNAILQVSR